MAMKATGIVRKLDELGRLVLPKELRKTLQIQNGDPVEIYVEEDRVILRKYQPVCIFCGSAEDLIDFEEKKVCKACIEVMKEEAE
ncbi:MAG: AbrB/MazE/SpoVT family DNA-binding domain-containing protein [Clostridia bacterium]|nr:AbrB/MazE/SpoVT family DNA-binding domain-containing protein [Clostridia bacterium]